MSGAGDGDVLVVGDLEVITSDLCDCVEQQFATICFWHNLIEIHAVVPARAGGLANGVENPQGDSLDRSDRFFTNVERTVQESQLPALSADSRKFFTTTSAQIEQIKSEMDGLVGTQGALIKFTEEARAAIKDADFPAATQSTRDAADSSRLAADDLRRSLPAIRDSLEQMREVARMLEEQPESIVYGQRPTKVKH